MTVTKRKSQRAAKFVKGGVLLYAMLMAALFSLVLGLYLKEEVESAKNLRSQQVYLSAQIMGELAKEKEAKYIRFEEGEVKVIDNTMTVTLNDGKKFIINK